MLYFTPSNPSTQSPTAPPQDIAIPPPSGHLEDLRAGRLGQVVHITRIYQSSKRLHGLQNQGPKAEGIGWTLCGGIRGGHRGADLRGRATLEDGDQHQALNRQRRRANDRGPSTREWEGKNWEINHY